MGPATAVAILLLFGLVFNLHVWAQSLVFQTDGALGVGCVNAVRGALIAVASDRLFCRPDRTSACLTPQTCASALLVMVGGIAWVRSTNGRAKSSGAVTRSKAKGL